jgi:hypothetical protein
MIRPVKFDNDNGANKIAFAPSKTYEYWSAGSNSTKCKYVDGIVLLRVKPVH